MSPLDESTDNKAKSLPTPDIKKETLQAQILKVFTQLSGCLSSQNVYHINGIPSEDDKTTIVNFFDAVTSVVIEFPSPSDTLSKMAIVQLSNLRSTLFPNLTHLRFEDGADNHNILPLLATPSLKYLRVQSVPEDLRLNFNCFFSTLVATAVDLEEVSFDGPSLLPMSMHHITALSSLRVLKLVDTGLIFRPSTFYDIGQLPLLEEFVLDVRRAGAVPVVQTPAFREGCDHPAMVPCPLDCGVAENENVQLEDGRVTPTPSEDGPFEPVVKLDHPASVDESNPSPVASSFPALTILKATATIYELHPLLDALAGERSGSRLKEAHITFVPAIFQEFHPEPPVAVSTSDDLNLTSGTVLKRKKKASITSLPTPPVVYEKLFYRWTSQLPPFAAALEQFLGTKGLGALESISLTASPSGSEVTIPLPISALRAILSLNSPTRVAIAGPWKGEPDLFDPKEHAPGSNSAMKTFSLPKTWPIFPTTLVALTERYPNLVDITCALSSLEDIPSFKAAKWDPTGSGRNGLEVLRPLNQPSDMSWKQKLSVSFFLYKHFPGVWVDANKMSPFWDEVDDLVSLCCATAHAPRAVVVDGRIYFV